MKFDSNLAIAILQAVEDDNNWPKRVDVKRITKTLSDESFEKNAVRYHFVLLIEEDLIKGEIKSLDYVNAPSKYKITVERLTKSGHDFLNDIRKPDVLKYLAERANQIASVSALVLTAKEIVLEVVQKSLSR